MGGVNLDHQSSDVEFILALFEAVVGEFGYIYSTFLRAH